MICRVRNSMNWVRGVFVLSFDVHACGAPSRRNYSIGIWYIV
jgi:hypothetical protein